ncbi:MAG: hypothetical protein SGJ11_05815 [Phycisphaerae bacterium]|nr:hypothetical protein [Phycisphaerae bacterium]
MPRVRDEGPSDEDLRRFGGESAYCPDCGANVWDQTDVCPKCYAYLGGDTARAPGAARRQRRERWRAIVVVLLIIGFLGLVGGIGPLLLRFLR